MYIPFDWDVDRIGESDAVDSTKALSLGIVNKSSQASAISSSLQTMGVKTNSSAKTAAVAPTSTSESSQSSSSSDSSISDKVNVNTATAGDLDKLPGIGPAYAGKIIENRPYAAFDEFKENSALSASLAESLKDLISF